MIIQIHTPEGIINLDTDINSDEEFATYGLTKLECCNRGMIDGCKIRVYEQDTEPDIGDQKIAIWIDTSTGGVTSLIFREGTGDIKKVELI